MIGKTLAHYEITALLGKGGMGEVYRARDTRLDREVAIKVLPETFASEPERMARFEREARLLASLNHPNIAALYGLETHEGLHVLVMELVEGKSLDEVIARGPLPTEEGILIAIQIAEGLEAAHEKDIVHRDLKPANIRVREDGTVKILDFGLAKSREAGPAEGALSRSPTITANATAVGALLGTAAYMSPEQARGTPVDKRADIWAFGVVLFEMFTGKRLFESETISDVLANVLRQEVDWSLLPGALPSALRRLLRRCLERNPKERLRDIGDARIELEQARIGEPDAPGSPSSGPRVAETSEPTVASRRVLVRSLVALLLIALGGIGGWAWSHRTGAAGPPLFSKLTFQRGTIFSARFVPDGNTVIFGADWRGTGLQLFSKRIGAPESRAMGLAADILAISPSGEMALSLGRHTAVSLLSTGQLARAPLGGGAPREMLDGVVDADWSPDGAKLAVTREIDGEARLEYPLGTVLYRSGGYLSSPRVSPDSSRVAFIRHQVKGDDRGAVVVVDTRGHVTVVSRDLPSVTGLAWGPRGREVWYSGWVPPGGYAIEAVVPGGRTRTVYRTGARIRLMDLRGDRALIGQENAMAGASGIMRGDGRERDLSYLDGTCPTDLSADGSMLLFSEAWIGGGSEYSFFVRRSPGGEPVRLGSGWASDLSQDGKWALSYTVDPPMRVDIVPTGPGQASSIALPEFDAIGGASWFPDARRILVWASKAGEAFRGYVIDVPAGAPRVITPPGVTAPLFSAASHPISPDGTQVVATGGSTLPSLYPVDGGEPKPVLGARPTDLPFAWTPDGRGLLVRDNSDVPAQVSVLDLRTGDRHLWKTLLPADPAGVLQILGIVSTPDRQFYAYTYLRALTELYVVSGLTEHGAR